MEKEWLSQNARFSFDTMQVYLEQGAALAEWNDPR
jgi:hypothetical protein